MLLSFENDFISGGKSLGSIFQWWVETMVFSPTVVWLLQVVIVAYRRSHTSTSSISSRCATVPVSKQYFQLSTIVPMLHIQMYRQYSKHEKLEYEDNWRGARNFTFQCKVNLEVN
mmetsp:Transcript_5046/g.32105  ORF Transcript_5046/g.32105 Transcript_5046/m.32105 type:complete len:115 (-) Transcript_5046:3531-3875(-)